MLGHCAGTVPSVAYGRSLENGPISGRRYSELCRSGAPQRQERPARRLRGEVRIFVDGVLAGRAGGCGCSLGAGGWDLPAVARVGVSRAITVDTINDIAFPIAELWEVAP
jgi:hypothetical protein